MTTMLERYRRYIQSHLLEGWAIQVAVVLAFTRVLTWVWPDKSDPSWFLVLICMAFVQPTFSLMMRLSEEGRRERPLPPSQERAIGVLSLVASVCAIGALSVGTFGRWAGWPLDTRVAWLIASFIAAVVAAMLGYGMRQTRAGRWGVGLSVAWGLLLVVYVLVMLLRRAAGYA